MAARPRAEAPAEPPAPLSLAEIRGHERPLGFLRRAFERGRLAHAYLFTGPPGIGKLATARALAMGLHCEVAPFDACGACASCRTIAAGTHPDVRTIHGPLKERRDISIDQVRELQRELGFRSMSPHPKIGIVNDAHLLTLQAQNALLKTLEEPAGATLLLLVGVSAATLAPTVLSRCQRLAFAPLPAADVAAILEAHGRPAGEAAAVAAYAEGSPGRALELDREFFATRRREILTRLAGLRDAGPKPLLDLAQDLASEPDPARALAVVASWHRDALRRALLGAGAALQNADLAARLPEASVAASLRNLETTYATIAALRQNANRSLALTQLLLRLTE
jgi:DNA polymerase-3 subunit delta'